MPIAAATVPLGYLRVAHVPVELFPLLADEVSTEIDGRRLGVRACIAAATGKFPGLNFEFVLSVGAGIGVDRGRWSSRPVAIDFSREVAAVKRIKSKQRLPKCPSRREHHR